MLRDLFAYRALVKNLVLKDLKLKYRDSVLGFVWSLVNPLVTLGVFTLAFRYIMRVQMENFPYFLMVGMLPWNFFAGSLMASTGAVIGNANLIKKVYFPREILPIATVLFGLAQLVLALVVFLPALMFFSGARVNWTMALFFPVLAMHLLFTIGLAFLLSAVTTAFRDVAHLTEVALMLLFWLTPIVYPASMAPAPVQAFFKSSPLAAFALAYQDVLFWGRVPEPLVFWTILGWTMGALFVGHAVFRGYSPTFAEVV